MRMHARLPMNGRSDTLRAARSGRSVLAGTPSRPSTLQSSLFVRSLVAGAILAAGLPGATASAQDVRIIPHWDDNRRVIILRDGQMMGDSPMIGVSTASESEKGDTLGLRIESVQPGSPAAKAGLKEGDRIQSVNSVNLRADRADAGEDDYSGVLNRRLQREVQRTTPGAAIELRVLTNGQARSVKVTPVKASELTGEEAREFTWTAENADRAVLGVTVASTGSLRDTLGLFVQSVVRDGPAEKAGVVEGDRIAAINGVSLRVAREDAEDESVGAVRAERLAREVAKLKAGEVAELTVVSGGRSRTVRVTTGKASDLPKDGAAGLFMRAPFMRAW